MNIEDDFTLIRQCLDGNTNSFEIIVKKYQLKLLNKINTFQYKRNYTNNNFNLIYIYNHDF